MTDLAKALDRSEFVTHLWLVEGTVIDAARRVVSGTPIRLCATHEGEVFHVIPGIMRGCYAGNEFKPCSGESVDRILIDPGEETE